MEVAAVVEENFLHLEAPAMGPSSWVLLDQNCRFHGCPKNLLEAVPRHLLAVAAVWSLAVQS